MHPIEPIVPTFCFEPSLKVYSHPIACAVSSTTCKLYFFARSIIASIFEDCPNKWTGTIALVLEVIDLSIASILIS